MSIDDIVIGCKEGNRKCQDALVQKFAPVLMAICIRYIGEQEMAKDALQETFINAFKYIHTFNFQGSFEGWLRRVAVTSSLNVKKKFCSINFDNIDDTGFLAQTTIPDAHNQMNVEDLLKVVKILPPSLMSVFNMHVVDGFSHTEISEQLGITESTSRAALTKARAKIINHLQKTEPATYRWAAAL